MIKGDSLASNDIEITQAEGFRYEPVDFRPFGSERARTFPFTVLRKEDTLCIYIYCTYFV